MIFALVKSILLGFHLYVILVSDPQEVSLVVQSCRDSNFKMMKALVLNKKKQEVQT